MTGLAWYKCYPRDFLDGLVGLTLEERGAYVTLLNLIYARGGELPDEPRWLAGNCLVSVRTWTKLRAALLVKRKLYVTASGGLMNERAFSELQKSAKPARNSGETPTKLPGKVVENEAELNKFNVLAPSAASGSDAENRDIDTDTETDKKAAAASATEREQLEQLEEALRAAAGPALNAASPSLLILAPILRLLSPTEGEPCSLEADVLPAVRACAAKQRPGSVRNWGYFTPAILEARDRRLSGVPEAQVIPYERPDRRPVQSGRESSRAVWAEIAAREAAAGPGGRS